MTNQIIVITRLSAKMSGLHASVHQFSDVHSDETPTAAMVGLMCLWVLAEFEILEFWGENDKSQATKDIYYQIIMHVLL